MTKLTVVTACFNSAKTILDTIVSVNDQTYPDIEHVFVDAGSTDNTCELIKKYSKRDFTLISEADRGIYDAMNKGFKIAKGDIVAFLNSDDIYDDHNIIELVMNKFKRDVDIVYGNIYFVDSQNVPRRTWITGNVPTKWRSGFQLPHPAFFMRSTLIKKQERLFDPTYRIAADLKLQLSLFKNGTLRYEYLDKYLVKMRLGGASTKNIWAILSGFLESRSVYNDIYGNGGLLFATKKILSKLKKKLLTGGTSYNGENN